MKIYPIEKISARDSEVARDTLKAPPVSDRSAQEATEAVPSGLETRVERAKAHEPNLTEVRQRLEQTRRSFRQLELRGTDREIIEAGDDLPFGFYLSSAYFGAILVAVGFTFPSATAVSFSSAVASSSSVFWRV